MRKRGFTMYTKEKNRLTLYTGYSPRFKDHQETELRAYVGITTAHDISQNVGKCVKQMASDIAGGIIDRRK